MTVPVAGSVTESVFSLRLWRSLLLVRFQVFAIKVVTESVMESVLSKASVISYNHENLTINGNDKICGRVCFW